MDQFINYQEFNSNTVDRWVAEGWEWGNAINMDEYIKAQKGDYDIKLTPVKFVPHKWIGNVKNKKVLGLASGGAQQMPIFAALGADVTVLDYSDAQLSSEREFANKAGYDIDIIKADMSQPLPFTDESFDLIFHPVSNIFVEKVLPIWHECYRILKNGGSLLSGLDIGINYVFDDDEERIIFTLPFNPLKNKEHLDELIKYDGGMQFSHTIDEQVGGQLEAGFTLKAIYSDTNGEGNLHEHNIPSFVATWSVK